MVSKRQSLEVQPLSPFPSEAVCILAASEPTLQFTLHIWRNKFMCISDIYRNLEAPAVEKKCIDFFRYTEINLFAGGWKKSSE